MNPTVTHDMSVLSLITGASVLVQLVMAMLLLASLLSWYYIFLKIFTLQARHAARRRVREGILERRRPERALPARGRARATRGHAWSASSRRASASSPSCASSPAWTSRVVMDGTRRAMRATYQREMERLESHLSFLASVGSVSPYVGLFGTVWGIMNSFRGLANVAQATLGARRAGHRRGADRDRHGPLRGDPGGDRLQPLRRRHQPPRHALRFVHGGVLQHPAAPG